MGLYLDDVAGRQNKARPCGASASCAPPSSAQYDTGTFSRGAFYLRVIIEVVLVNGNSGLDLIVFRAPCVPLWQLDCPGRYSGFSDHCIVFGLGYRSDRDCHLPFILFFYFLIIQGCLLLSLS